MHRKGEKLAEKLSLTGPEKNYFSDDKILFVYNSYYFDLINPEDPEDPIRKQAVPTICERTEKPYEKADPLLEQDFSPLPGLIHRYKNRVLILTTDKCALYCRHCFRRHFTGEGRGEISDKEFEDILHYIKERPEIKEVLLSGGDPLTLSDTKIEGILSGLRKVSPELIIRMGTRIPAVLPQRITVRLADIMAGYRPIWMITHINHSRELTPRTKDAINLITGRSIPVANQSVLLRGVNDSVPELRTLCNGLLSAGIKPYYLLQGDLAAGTSHLRVPVTTSLKLYKQLREEISGLAMPVLAVDLPEGGGKIPLTADHIAGEENGWMILKDDKGREFRYPIEDMLPDD